MKVSTRLFFLLLCGFLCFSLVSEVIAQRNLDYRDLRIQQQRSPVYTDFIVLPGETDQSVKFATVFSISYQYLPFKKLPKSKQTTEDHSFYSPVSMNMEVFNASEEQLKRNDQDISVERLESVERSSWRDTAYTSTYEETQSERNFISGSMNVSLTPGIYSYVLQMNRGDNNENQFSRVRTSRIQSYRDMKQGAVYFGKEVSKQQDNTTFNLLSMGQNVQYGKDFHALIYIPDFKQDVEYTMTIFETERSESDTSNIKQLFSETISEDNIYRNIRPVLRSSQGTNTLHLQEDPNGFTYAMVNVPNSTFPNTTFNLQVKEKDSDKRAVQSSFRSLWIDMPRSLLSLDVAIDMLQYITDEETIDRLSSGSQKEQERKFRDFWQEKDPTPKTEYNELMAEYYRRVDYAFENFTTENTIGYNSDRGEIYIKFGSPDNIQRKYPTDGSTVEIWTYPNRKFVFEATTGFGDFRLKSN